MFKNSGAVFFARKQSANVFMMRRPRQNIYQKQNSEQRNNPAVQEFARVSYNEQHGLPDCEQRHAEMRAHRPPLRQGDINKQR